VRDATLVARPWTRPEARFLPGVRDAGAVSARPPCATTPVARLRDEPCINAAMTRWTSGGAIRRPRPLRALLRARSRTAAQGTQWLDEYRCSGIGDSMPSSVPAPQAGTKPHRGLAMTERQPAIRLVRVLPASPDEVFDAWTDPRASGNGCARRHRRDRGHPGVRVKAVHDV